MSSVGKDFLHTNISPKFSAKGWKTNNECFREELAKADRVEISVAYCSCDSLQELEKLVDEGNIKYICLILGMHFFVGFSEDSYKLVLEINEKWVKRGMGEIRLTHSFKHHEKLYCFYKNDQIFSVMFGSPNLSFLITERMKKPKQNDMAWLSNDPFYLKNSLEHMEILKMEEFTSNVVELEKYRSFESEKPKERRRSQKSKITFKKGR